MMMKRDNGRMEVKYLAYHHIPANVISGARKTAAK